MNTGTPPLVEPPAEHDYYCTECQQNVGDQPTEHRGTEHDGSAFVDIYPIDEDEGEFIAKDSQMGHFSPHVWGEVDGVPTCVECGAVKVYVAGEAE